MRPLATMLAVVVLMSLPASAALGAPAWGENCLSCHSVLRPNSIAVFGEDGLADPDETNTGAPDRGELKVYEAPLDRVEQLFAEVTGLAQADKYAVTLKRLRFAGVEDGGNLSYAADCAWPQWGEESFYYTEPTVTYTWGQDPTAFNYDITIQADAELDYYDVVFAVAGKNATDGTLFYDEEHFYLRVVELNGDINGDGSVNMGDLLLVLSAWGPCDPPPCPEDLNGDEVVDFADLLIILANWG